MNMNQQQSNLMIPDPQQYAAPNGGVSTRGIEQVSTDGLLSGLQAASRLYIEHEARQQEIEATQDLELLRQELSLRQMEYSERIQHTDSQGMILDDENKPMMTLQEYQLQFQNETNSRVDSYKGKYGSQAFAKQAAAAAEMGWNVNIDTAKHTLAMNAALGEHRAMEKHQQIVNQSLVPININSTPQSLAEISLNHAAYLNSQGHIPLKQRNQMIEAHKKQVWETYMASINNSLKQETDPVKQLALAGKLETAMATRIKANGREITVGEFFGRPDTLEAVSGLEGFQQEIKAKQKAEQEKMAADAYQALTIQADPVVQNAAAGGDLGASNTLLAQVRQAKANPIVANDPVMKAKYAEMERTIVASQEINKMMKPFASATTPEQQVALVTAAMANVPKNDPAYADKMRLLNGLLKQANSDLERGGVEINTAGQKEDYAKKHGVSALLSEEKNRGMNPTPNISSRTQMKDAYNRHDYNAIAKYYENGRHILKQAGYSDKDANNFALLEIGEVIGKPWLSGGAAFKNGKLNGYVASALSAPMPSAAMKSELRKLMLSNSALKNDFGLLAQNMSAVEFDNFMNFITRVAYTQMMNQPGNQAAIDNIKALYGGGDGKATYNMGVKVNGLNFMETALDTLRKDLQVDAYRQSTQPVSGRPAQVINILSHADPLQVRLPNIRVTSGPDLRKEFRWSNDNIAIAYIGGMYAKQLGLGTLEVTSGKRYKGSTSYHDKGTAMDFEFNDGTTPTASQMEWLYRMGKAGGHLIVPRHVKKMFNSRYPNSGISVRDDDDIGHKETRGNFGGHENHFHVEFPEAESLNSIKNIFYNNTKVIRADGFDKLATPDGKIIYQIPQGTGGYQAAGYGTPAPPQRQPATNTTKQATPAASKKPSSQAIPLAPSQATAPPKKPPTAAQPRYAPPKGAGGGVQPLNLGIQGGLGVGGSTYSLPIPD